MKDELWQDTFKVRGDRNSSVKTVSTIIINFLVADDVPIFD